MRGFTLIEVTIALVLISVALLGLGSACLLSKQRSMSAYYRGVAMHQMNQWREIELYSKETSRFAAWKAENKQLLPGAIIKNEVPLTLCWMMGGELCVA